MLDLYITAMTPIALLRADSTARLDTLLGLSRDGAGAICGPAALQVPDVTVLRNRLRGRDGVPIEESAEALDEQTRSHPNITVLENYLAVDLINRDSTTGRGMTVSAANQRSVR